MLPAAPESAIFPYNNTYILYIAVCGTVTIVTCRAAGCERVDLTNSVGRG